MRDFQRSAVYKSEDQAFGKSSKPEYETIAQCEEYANKIINSEYWKSQKGLKRFKLRDGRGRVHACSKGRKKGRGSDVYFLPRWSRSRWIIIHEFSHGLTNKTDKGTSDHGAVFCKHYLMLIRELLGEDSYKMLVSKFNENSVKYLKH